MNFVKGKRLTNQEVNEILRNFLVSTHSVKRLFDRRCEVLGWTSKGKVDIDVTKDNVKKDIRKNLSIAFFDTDKSVNIYVDDSYYYVFAPEFNGAKIKYWTLITFKEPSSNGISAFEKQKYAEINYARKENKNE